MYKSNTVGGAGALNNMFGSNNAGRAPSRGQSPFRSTTGPGGKGISMLGTLANRDNAPSQTRGPSAAYVQGYPGISVAQEDPNRQMLKEVGADTTTMAQRLAKEQEDERVLNQLRQEFSRIDVNQDGRIRQEEILNFLKDLTQGNFDSGLAEQLFQ